MDKHKISCQGIITSDEGNIEVGEKVRFKDSRYGENKEFTVSEVTYTVDLETFHSKVTSTYFVKLEELPGKEFLTDDIYKPPINYNVYRWKRHYILAKSPEEALKVWNSMIDELLLISSDSRKPKMYKLIENLNRSQEKEVLPVYINMKCEYQFPCIIKNLDWNEDPMFVYYENT